MNILLLVKIFPPHHTGGVPNYYYNLLQCIKKFSTTIVANGKFDVLENDFDKKYMEESGNSRVIRKKYFPEYMGLSPSFKWAYLLIWSIFSNLKTIKNNNIDYIVVGQARAFLLLSSYLCSLITGKKYIVFLHGEEIPQIQMKSNLLIRFLYRKSSGFICNSNFTANRLGDFIGAPVACHIVTPGVESRFFNSSLAGEGLSERLGIVDRKVVYTIARLDERKGQDMVIQAMPQIIKSHPDVVYLIGGKGPYEKKLRALVDQLELTEYIKFLGFIPDEDIVLYHQIGDVFAMPNRILPDGDSEGFGIVFLEANAAGRPVVGGNVGGSVDAIEDGVSGYCVDPYSVEEVARSLCTLLDNAELRVSLGAAGKDRALQFFQWPELGRQFEEAMTLIHAKSGGSHGV